MGYELPPGMWRKAIKPHEKSKCILMRYSTVYDKQDVMNKSADAEDGGLTNINILNYLIYMSIQISLCNIINFF